MSLRTAVEHSPVKIHMGRYRACIRDRQKAVLGMKWAVRSSSNNFTKDGCRSGTDSLLIITCSKSQNYPKGERCRKLSPRAPLQATGRRRRSGQVGSGRQLSQDSTTARTVPARSPRRSRWVTDGMLPFGDGVRKLSLHLRGVVEAENYPIQCRGLSADSA